MGGKLPVPQSDEEHRALMDFKNAKNLGHIWIGLTDVQESRIWRNMEGHIQSYYNWKADEPNNANEKCVNSWTGDLWNDYRCSVEQNVVCEVPCPAQAQRLDNKGIDAVFLVCTKCGTEYRPGVNCF